MKSLLIVLVLFGSSTGAAFQCDLKVPNQELRPHQGTFSCSAISNGCNKDSVWVRLREEYGNRFYNFRYSGYRDLKDYYVFDIDLPVKLTADEKETIYCGKLRKCSGGLVSRHDSESRKYHARISLEINNANCNKNSSASDAKSSGKTSQ